MKLTFREAYHVEVRMAENITCPHGNVKAHCPSSMCYIHTPDDIAAEDEDFDPDAEMSPDEKDAFFDFLQNHY